MGTGFFGKLPATGDFAARGLPAGVQGALDRWLTGAIVPLASAAKGWPEGGVRAVLVLNGVPWLLVIEPSVDAVGRRYPLVACCAQDGADLTGADIWADAASAALLAGMEANTGPEALHDLLAQLGLPLAGQAPLAPPALWWNGVQPGPVEPRLARLAQISSG